MEDFLLLFDELDDLFAIAGALWRPVASFVIAILLFVATGFVFYSMPMLAEAIAFVLVVLGVISTFRERRATDANTEQVTA